MNSEHQKLEVPFGQVPNSIMYDPNLSLKAKGLYAYMRCKPNGWRFAAERISDECKEETKAIRSALSELEDNGYLIRKKLPNGTMEYTFLLEKANLPKADVGSVDPTSQNVSQTKRLPDKNGWNSNTEGDSNTEEEVRKSVATTEDFELAEFMVKRIRENIPQFKAPSSMRKWAEEINRIIRIDKRTYKQVQWMIDWTQDDSFWAANIMSPAKLRKQFDRLIAEVKGKIKRQEKPKFSIGSITK